MWSVWFLCELRSGPFRPTNRPFTGARQNPEITAEQKNHDTHPKYTHSTQGDRT